LPGYTVEYRGGYRSIAGNVIKNDQGENTDRDPENGCGKYDRDDLPQNRITQVNEIAALLDSRTSMPLAHAFQQQPAVPIVHIHCVPELQEIVA
jgi:hypothetical protein